MLDSNSPIDWRDILKITNNKPELAKEMVAMLGAELPDMKTDINHAHRTKQFRNLLEKVHKLHGSCCYCGVPQLKNIAATLEMKLKRQDYQQIEPLLQALNHEIDHILNYLNQQAMTT